MQSSWNVDDGCAIEVLRKPICLKCRAHEHDFEVSAVLKLLTSPRHQYLDIKVPFVNLIDHQYVAISLSKEFANQRQAVSAEQTARILVVSSLACSAKAYSIAKATTVLFCYTLCDGSCCEPSRLGYDQSISCIKQILRNLSRFPCTGFSSNDGYSICCDRSFYIFPKRRYWKRLIHLVHSL